MQVYRCGRLAFFAVFCKIILVKKRARGWKYADKYSNM